MSNDLRSRSVRDAKRFSHRAHIKLVLSGIFAGAGVLLCALVFAPQLLNTPPHALLLGVGQIFMGCGFLAWSSHDSDKARDAWMLGQFAIDEARERDVFNQLPDELQERADALAALKRLQGEDEVPDLPPIDWTEHNKGVADEWRGRS